MPVYMIRAGENGPVKIGYSADPVGRLGELQVAHYASLRIIRLLAGGEAEEAGLHIRFADLLLRGEWFSFSRFMLGDVGLIDVTTAETVPLDNGPLILDDLPTARDIGLRIRSLRKSRGLSQAVVAENLGMARSTLAELEGGAHFPVLATLLRASKYFGVPLTMEAAA